MTVVADYEIHDFAGIDYILRLITFYRSEDIFIAEDHVLPTKSEVMDREVRVCIDRKCVLIRLDDPYPSFVRFLSS